MKASLPIPISARIFGWLLVAAGLFFAYVFAFHPTLSFPGIAADGVSAKFGLYSTSVRVLGSVLGILIALIVNNRHFLALMLATRAFIELGDVLVGFNIYGEPNANTFILSALAAVELYFVFKLSRTTVANLE